MVATLEVVRNNAREKKKQLGKSHTGGQDDLLTAREQVLQQVPRDWA